MKFKVLSALLTILTVGTLVLSGCNKTSGEVYKFTYSNFFPATHYNSILAEQWIQEIEQRANGAVDITYLSGGQLVAAAQTYDGVVQGICDIGMSVFAYTPGRFPACELVDLPQGYPNGWVATMVANDFYNEFKPAELNDVHPLLFHATGPYVIFTTNKPVRTMSDLNGLVLRATGTGTKIVQALGAQGYGASQGEAADLLTKGVVDGNHSTLESLTTWNQAEVVKYVTNCSAVGNTSMMFVVMNKTKWESLPSNIQKIFTDVSKEFIDKHGKAWSYLDEEATRDFLALGGGREVITLSQSEIDNWVAAAAQPLIDAYVSEKSAAGLPASEYETYIKSRVAYWSSRVPSAETTKTFIESEVINWIPETK
jgi:TRAP-type C4-dicarboxylate transport system substrate-binding protein